MLSALKRLFVAKPKWDSTSGWPPIPDPWPPPPEPPRPTVGQMLIEMQNKELAEIERRFCPCGRWLMTDGYSGIICWECEREAGSQWRP